MYRGRPWTIRQYAGFRLGGGVERPVPLPPRAGADRALGRLRPPDPARARLRRPARRGRGRAYRSRDRLARRHGGPARRHPARPGLDVDDDQRARPRSSCSSTSSSPSSRASTRRRCAARCRTTSSRSTSRAAITSSRRARRCGSRPTSSRTAPRGSRAGTRSRSPGYHIREAGSTAVQELAFTLANGIAYCQAAVDVGLDPDVFGARLSFFFNAHNDFLQEVAKFRAARRLWAGIMERRFGVTSPQGARAPLPRSDRRLDAHGAAARGERGAGHDPGAVGGARRLPVAPHERLRRGARSAVGARRDGRAPHAAGDRARVGRHLDRRPARRLLLRRGAHARARGAGARAHRRGGRARRRGRGDRGRLGAGRDRGGGLRVDDRRSRPAPARSSG